MREIRIPVPPERGGFFSLLPIAYCLTAYCLIASCPLLTAYCVLLPLLTLFASARQTPH